MHSNNTNNLINLKGVKIKSIQHLDETILIHIETKATAQTCPHCGNSTTRIHDYRTQKIKHFPILHKSVFLYLRKRRYTCTCGKHFYEAYSFLPKYMRMSTDLVKFIIHECRNQTSFTTVANQTHVSTPTVIRLFDKIKYPKPSTLPEVLCIDEFRGNAGGEKFQCIIIDGKNEKY